MNAYDRYFKERSEAARKGSKSGRYRLAPEGRGPFGALKRKLDRRSAGPLWIGILATALAGGSIWYMFMGGEQKAAGIFNKVSVSVFGEAAADENTATDSGAATVDSHSDDAKSADAKTTAEAKIAADGQTNGTTNNTGGAASTKIWTDEEITLFTKLDARKKELDAREASLIKLEEELQKQKEILEKKLASLEDVRGQIADRLEDKVKVDQEKIESLVAVYSNMKPAQAARIIEGLNDDLAVEVLGKMKNKAAADILNQMDATRAEKLSERFAGFREPAGRATVSAGGSDLQSAVPTAGGDNRN